jgi:ABC-type cobalamin/Fe3+-siderophores transport system ATPase subunit
VPTTQAAALAIRALAPGAFAVLLGLNGAETSTRFGLIARLFTWRSTTIRIFGRDLQRDPGAAPRLLRIVFQSRIRSKSFDVSSLYPLWRLYGQDFWPSMADVLAGTIVFKAATGNAAN